MFNLTWKVVVVLAILLAICIETTAFAADVNVTWIGTDDKGHWDNPSNWDPAVVPQNGVPAGDTYNVTINTSKRIGIFVSGVLTIRSLTCSGEIDFTQSEFTILEITNSPLFNSGILEFSGEGVHALIGSIVNNSGAELKLSNLLEVREGYVLNDGYIEILGLEEHTGLTLGDGLLTNNGRISFINASLISTGTGIINSSSGEIEGSGWILGSSVQNQGLISATFGELSVISAATLSNSGTIKNAPGASVLVISFSPAGATVLNDGMVKVNAGGGITFNTPLKNTTTGIINLLDGVLAAPNMTQSSGADISGFGTLTGNILIESNGEIKLSGPTNILGTVNIEANATLEISDGQALVVGHTVNNGTIHLKSGGIARFQGGLTDNGTVIHEDGSYYTQDELDQEIEIAISKYDPSLDGQVGLEEAIHALRVVSDIVTQ